MRWHWWTSAAPQIFLQSRRFDSFSGSCNSEIRLQGCFQSETICTVTEENIFFQHLELFECSDSLTPRSSCNISSFFQQKHGELRGKMTDLGVLRSRATYERSRQSYLDPVGVASLHQLSYNIRSSHMKWPILNENFDRS